MTDWLERFASKNSWDPETCMTEQKVLVAHAKASRQKSCHFMEQRFHHCHSFPIIFTEFRFPERALFGWAFPEKSGTRVSMEVSN